MWPLLFTICAVIWTIQRGRGKRFQYGVRSEPTKSMTLFINGDWVLQHLGGSDIFEVSNLKSVTSGVVEQRLHFYLRVCA